MVFEQNEERINTRIRGAFNGWHGNTIVELDNGKIWKQIQWRYIYTYKYYPKVSLCYKGYKWCMQVEGMDAID